MTPSPPLQSRAIRNASSFASLPVQQNMAIGSWASNNAVNRSA